MKKINTTTFIFSRITGIIFLLIFSAQVLIAGTRVENLQLRLDQIINGSSGIISAQVVSADKYDLLYEYNPKQKMIPASITKLITSAAALHYLGTGYQFRTMIYSDDSDIDDGIINGNLYIKGFGDPDLYSGDMVTLAKYVVAKNIKSITGNIVYDDTYLDNQYYGLANTLSGDTKSNYWPYVSGINLDKNPKGYNPGASAANIFLNELIARGVAFNGIVVSGIAPPSSKMVTQFSHDIADVLTTMNKRSDNHSAITIFKVIGAKHVSPPGTLEKGQQAVINFLTSMGNPRTIFEVLEGSGLTRYNQVNSDLFIRMLKYLYDDIYAFDIFYNSLAIAGRDGTLSSRMIGTEAEANIHAKTGTLNSVSTLSGYAVSRDHELLIFYIAMNGFGGSNSVEKRRQDQICEALCQFSRN
jgi:D-alanyl-D-alanine carboxypeptidase/D-alanyl-D-alanine-endopeptidase (penicillin-binding protein 4)